MRVVVDLAVCQGYAQCAFLAPDVYRLSGPEGLMYDPNPSDQARERVSRAAAACPVKAITIEPSHEPSHESTNEPSHAPAGVSGA